MQNSYFLKKHLELKVDVSSASFTDENKNF